MREKEVEPSRRQVEHSSIRAIRKTQLPRPLLAPHRVELVQQDRKSKDEDEKVEREDDDGRVLRVRETGLILKEVDRFRLLFDRLQRPMKPKEQSQDQ